MMQNISLCALLVVGTAITLVVIAFYQIFQRKTGNENDLQVIQRQLRSFALLMVANLTLIGGLMFCGGTLIPQLMNLIR